MSKPIKEANPSNFYSKSSSVIREKYGNKSLGKGDITRLVNPSNIIEKKLKPSEDKLKLVIDKIESSDKKLQALGELKSIVNAMIDANNKLINNYPNNVFSQKTSELSTDDILSANDYLKVSTNSTAITDSYNVSVKQLAQKAILMVGENSNTDNTLDGFNNQDQAFKATKITVTVSDLNTPIDIDLNSNDTLVNIISKINNNQTLMSKNISARILSFPDNTGSSKYYLELVRNDTGQYKIDVDFTFDNNVSTFAKNIKEGTNAKFIINGSAASESNSNKLEIAKGITIEAIRKNSDGNSQNIIIKNDVEAAKSGIINLFNAWNKYAEFSAKQYEKNGNNEFVDTAYLGGSSVLRTVNPMFQNFFSSNSGFNYATLGFELSKTEGNGPTHKEFIYNNTTLERMLNNNFEDVMLLFKGEGSIVIDPISDSTNSEIKFSPNSKNPTNFSDGVKFDLAIQVEADGTVYVAYDLEGTENLESAEETENLESAHYNNITNIISFEGTKLEGIEFYYKNNESNKLEVYNVKLFQGISEKFAKNLDSIINKQTSNGIQKGAIDREISKLISEKTLLQKQEEETQKILDAKIAKIDLELKKVQLKQTQLDADLKIFKNLSSN